MEKFGNPELVSNVKLLRL